MSEEWKQTTLGEVITLQRGFDLPTKDRIPGNIPVIASTGPVGTHNEVKVRVPGVVIGRSGSIGGAQYINQNFWPLNTTLWVKDFKGNNERFVYYFLKNIDFDRFNAGSGVPTLNRNHIHPMPVLIPPLPEQHAIAHVLGTLDDKIELNRKMNHTLEEMARAIFKSWFVDFDPVRAKMAGKKPHGMDEATAALFPDKLVWNEELQREVPEGWGAGTIYTFTNVIYGAPFSSQLFNEKFEGLPLLRIRDLNTHKPRIFTTEKHPKGTKVRPGDIVVGMDCEFRSHLWCGPVSWLNQRVCMFVPHDPEKRTYVRFSIKEPLSFYERSKVGTTVIHLAKKDIDAFQILIPPEEILDSFSKLVESLTQKQIVNELESHTLATIRDTLLPKLISGEMRIKDAERFLEERGIV